MKIGYQCNGGWGGEPDVVHMEIENPATGHAMQITIGPSGIHINSMDLDAARVDKHSLNAMDITFAGHRSRIEKMQDADVPSEYSSPGMQPHAYKPHERDANRCALCDYPPKAECHHQGKENG